MARNSSGVYSLPNAAFTANTVIASATMNSNLSDVATALTQSLATTGVSSMTGPVKLAAGTIAAPSLTLASDLGTGIYNSAAGEMTFVSAGVAVGKWNAAGLAGSDNSPLSTPIGMVVDYAGSTAPAKWLFCFGQQVSTTTYALLFAVISTIYGSGAGTFGIPDLRGRVTYGRDNMGGVAANRITAALNWDGTSLGLAGGAQSFTMTGTQLPAHTHTITDPTHNHGASTNASQIVAGSGVAFGGNFSSVGSSVTVNAASTGITATNSTGTGSAFSILSPGLTLNKIIYAGV